MRFALLSVPGILVACWPISGQYATKIQTPLPPGSIDGSKTPELIPDAKAYEVFFNVIALPSNASAQDRSRVRDKFSKAHLTDADVAILEAEMNKFYTQRTALDQTIRNASTSEQFDQQWSSLVDVTRTLVLSKLSTDGATKLDQYVKSLKTHIKLIEPIVK